MKEPCSSECEGIGGECKCPIEEGGSKSASVTGYTFMYLNVAKIHSKRVQRIIAGIDHMISRGDCYMAEDEFGKAIDHLKNAIERIKA